MNKPPYKYHPTPSQKQLIMICTFSIFDTNNSTPAASIAQNTAAFVFVFNLALLSMYITLKRTFPTRIHRDTSLLMMILFYLGSCSWLFSLVLEYGYVDSTNCGYFFLFRRFWMMHVLGVALVIPAIAMHVNKLYVLMVAVRKCEKSYVTVLKIVAPFFVISGVFSLIPEYPNWESGLVQEGDSLAMDSFRNYFLPYVLLLVFSFGLIVVVFYRLYQLRKMKRSFRQIPITGGFLGLFGFLYLMQQVSFLTNTPAGLKIFILTCSAIFSCSYFMVTVIFAVKDVKDHHRLEKLGRPSFGREYVNIKRLLRNEEPRRFGKALTV